MADAVDRGGESARKVLVSPQEERFLRYWRDFWWNGRQLDYRGRGTFYRITESALGEESMVRWRGRQVAAPEELVGDVAGPAAAEQLVLGELRAFLQDRHRHQVEDAEFFETRYETTEYEVHRKLVADPQKPFPNWWYRSSIALTRMFFGGAVGDAYGQAVEDLPVAEVVRDLADGSVRSRALGETTGCTRRALLFAEAMVCGHVALRRSEPVDVDRLIDDTYRRCLQVEKMGSGATGGWLLADPRMRGSSGWDRQTLNALVVRENGGSAADRASASRMLVHAAPLALFWDRHYNPRNESAYEKLLAFGFGVAGQVVTSSEDQWAMAAVPLLVRRLPNEQTVLRAFSVVEFEMRRLPGGERGVEMIKALRQLAEDKVRPESAVQQLAAEFGAESALGVLAIAGYAAEHGRRTSFDEGIAVSVLHGGDRLASANLCGQLLGTNLGPAAIPRQWIEQLDIRDLVAELAADVLQEVGPDSPETEKWSERYSLAGVQRTEDSERNVAIPNQSHVTHPPLDPHERFRGAMLAGAVGDGLGYAIEFKDIGVLREEFGPGGVSGPVLRGGVARGSDDTQMMLFTLEGLIRAHVAGRMEPRDNDPVPEVQHAYQRWYHTQGRDWLSAGGPYAQRIRRPDGWLITNPGLFDSRAPGNTCLTALSNFAQTGVSATPQHRINDSKGCGGVMRAAPVAVWSNDPAEVFYAAVGTAALTHSHPSGFLSAGVLAVIVHQLIREVSLPDSVRLARELLTRWPEHEEQLRVLDKAVALAGEGPVSPEDIARELGGGWVGEEALAIGLYAVLATDDLREALLISVNHSGDSDSTGMVCGNIGGALYGTRAIPPEWLETLELRGLVETVAEDALAEFSPGPPTDPGWAQRYPAW
ncbi:ADP-ribosylglycohydrolase family protein [Saccharopolyspora endophytica]|uniref:ADP-ribosylglycohydrolase family protein n=1 Tax=Saccharopolyspora endophytica TaxID=543886 RepID=A0ABS5D990_9PSEU|nr:ADP-ribosylglycohydrolase family protein [Saccharopolyspora endophytica]MBQ0922855.1 ADP-ribosylglycohydrolase family protein [Saccharopolyspora endophytica]